jgi:acyl carrier protein
MRDGVLDCIYAAVDEANEQRDGKPPIAKSPETSIHGDASGLDSLGLINFVVAVEENVERAFGRPIMLADDRALTRDPSPFDSITELGTYVEELLEEPEAEGAART